MIIKLTLKRSTDTAASAILFTVGGNRPRQNLIELKIAIVVKAYKAKRYKNKTKRYR